MPVNAQEYASTVKAGARQHSTLILFILCIFSFSSANLMLNFFLPVYMKAQGLSDGQIGTVFGLMSISALVLMLPLGVLSDLFSPRRLVLLGSCIFIFFAWQILTAKTYWQFLLVAPLGGIAGSSFFIVLYALLLKVIDKNQVGKKIAFYQSGMYLGLGIGPAIGGILIREGGFGALLWGVLAGGLIAVTLVLKLPDTETIRLDWGGYKRDLGQGRILLFLLLVFVYPTHFGVEQTTLTLLMKESLDFSFTNIGLVYLMVGIWMAFLAPFAGHRFDTSQSLRALLLCGLAISGTFQILTSMVTSLPFMVHSAAPSHGWGRHDDPVNRSDDRGFLPRGQDGWQLCGCSRHSHLWDIHWQFRLWIPQRRPGIWLQLCCQWERSPCFRHFGRQPPWDVCW